MGYTLSFDASQKCKAGDVRGWLHHAARDIDQQQGHEVRHANKDIDQTRTANNETAYYDQETRQHDQCRDIDQVEQSIAARLATVTKPLRKDAVVLRPLVLQLDPRWYAAHPGEQEREQAASDMMDWAVDTFGANNLVLMSRHRDETNEHLHFGFCPVTEDGRLSQKDWFSSPKKLQEMHQSFRRHMIDRGYDIDLDNKKPGKHAKRLPDREYKDFAELEKQRKDLERRENAVRVQEQEAQKRLQATSEALQQAQELLDDIRDQGAREALQSRLNGLQRPLPSITPRAPSTDPTFSL